MISTAQATQSGSSSLVGCPAAQGRVLRADGQRASTPPNGQPRPGRSSHPSSSCTSGTAPRCWRCRTAYRQRPAARRDRRSDPRLGGQSARNQGTSCRAHHARPEHAGAQTLPDPRAVQRVVAAAVRLAGVLGAATTRAARDDGLPHPGRSSHPSSSCTSGTAPRCCRCRRAHRQRRVGGRDRRSGRRLGGPDAGSPGTSRRARHAKHGARGR